MLSEAANGICGKRLKPSLPVLVDAMERHGHLQLALEVREGVLGMVGATDRPFAGRGSGASGAASAPARSAERGAAQYSGADVFGLAGSASGFFEADLVGHSGPVASGSFVQTLVLTNIATGWTECAPLLVREQGLLVEVLTELRKLLPFPVLGLDSDNDSV